MPSVKHIQYCITCVVYSGCLYYGCMMYICVSVVCVDYVQCTQNMCEGSDDLPCSSKKEAYIYRIEGIIGEGEVFANWRIRKICQIKFQPYFTTTHNTYYICVIISISIETFEDVNVYIFSERSEGLGFTSWILHSKYAAKCGIPLRHTQE